MLLTIFGGKPNEIVTYALFDYYLWLALDGSESEFEKERE